MLPISCLSKLVITKIKGPMVRNSLSCMRPAWGIQIFPATRAWISCGIFLFSNKTFFVYTWLNFLPIPDSESKIFNRFLFKAKRQQFQWVQLVLHKLLHEIWMSILLLIFECATKTVFKTLISDHVKIYPKIVSSNL